MKITKERNGGESRGQSKREGYSGREKRKERRADDYMKVGIKKKTSERETKSPRSRPHTWILRHQKKARASWAQSAIQKTTTLNTTDGLGNTEFKRGRIHLQTGQERGKTHDNSLKGVNEGVGGVTETAQGQKVRKGKGGRKTSEE